MYCKNSRRTRNTHRDVITQGRGNGWFVQIPLRKRRLMRGCQILGESQTGRAVKQAILRRHLTAVTTVMLLKYALK